MSDTGAAGEGHPVPPPMRTPEGVPEDSGFSHKADKMNQGLRDGNLSKVEDRRINFDQAPSSGESPSIVGEPGSVTAPPGQPDRVIVGQLNKDA
eukprot:TRINITY_DN826_c0_g1_i3.p1 TRINITY_DN826_c0_g1~~TRINITY_DN826_c0_g1_i3.p1  ORF type:complete len:108 (-),score=35.19 TRINITY_DN826_c0_g1_i3:361-642(-)